MNLDYRFQLHVGEAIPEPGKYVYGYGGTGDTWNKPQSAFWTSTAIVSKYVQSEWTRYCWFGDGARHWVNRDTFFLMEIDLSNLSIYEVTDKASFDALEQSHYSNRVYRPFATRHHIDWKSVSRVYDAVRVTPEALNNPALERVLNGWDVESTAWFRMPPNMQVRKVRRTSIFD